MPIQARYYRLVAAGDVRFEQEQFDPSDVAEDEILCRTVMSAISPGTELAAFEGLEPLRTNVPAYPRWLGYMNVAEVVRAGRKAINHFPEGSSVYSHSGHRSHFRLETEGVIASVPPELNSGLASLAYLYRLAWMGLRRGEVESGRTVAIVGMGAIGQCAVELATMFGSKCLAVSDHRNARLSAQRLGGLAIGRNEAEERFVRGGPSDGERFDTVLVTTNSWRDWQIALALARFGGVISVIGFPGRGQGSPELNPLLPAHFYDRQLTIMSAGIDASAAGGHGIHPALQRDTLQILDWMGTGQIDPSRVCMGAHPANDLIGAYHRLRMPDRGVGTLVLDWTVV
jgi:threonine dehydrogenase-like Zn-dependent dehydrogenase